MAMTKEKRAKLEAAGFKLTDTKDWIGLTIEESRIVEMRVALAQELEKIRKEKGITQEIPQQAILHKTGIIAESGASTAQKEAAKHKTARISLSDAMGVAPVKSEGAPMKTIRIKRPDSLPAAAPASAEATEGKPNQFHKSETSPVFSFLFQRPVPSRVRRG